MKEFEGGVPTVPHDALRTILPVADGAEDRTRAVATSEKEGALTGLRAFA